MVLKVTSKIHFRPCFQEQMEVCQYLTIQESQSGLLTVQGCGSFRQVEPGSAIEKCNKMEGQAGTEGRCRGPEQEARKGHKAEGWELALEELLWYSNYTSNCLHETIGHRKMMGSPITSRR